jgi:spore coat polysaccharide biosynthesis predicted glycosyltransferase SpsG
MKVLILADDRRGSGRGHIVRCHALGEALTGRGWYVDVVGIGKGEMLDADVVVMDLLPDARVPIERGQRSVQIVDDTSLVPRCDILVCGSAGANEGMFRVASAGRVLAGPQYSLLRPDFSRAREKSIPRSDVLDLRLMAGFSVNGMVDLIASASVVISYGGMRAMECACAGTPTVLIPRNDGEQLNAAGLLAAEACVIAVDYEAAYMAQTLLDSPTLLRRMGEKARELVDGRGVKRVAQAITELMRVRN